MDLNNGRATNELQFSQAQEFADLQRWLAAHDVELHSITGATGREAFTGHVAGALRTLDTLSQVRAYARIIGVPLVQTKPTDGIGGPQC